jgi:hypothetical protein
MTPVDGDDFVLLAADWADSGPAATLLGDINGDETVDLTSRERQ